jgi:Protein of unknown function (DUF4011)
MTTTRSNPQVTDRLEDWRRRLIDLSYRNRLIKYAVTRASTLEIDSPDIEALFEDVGDGKPWNFYFPPEDDEGGNEDDDEATSVVDDLVTRAARAARTPRTDEIVVRGDLTAHRINRILDNLARKSNAEFQDKALRILYLAAGFLDWRDPTRSDEQLSSPLILVPVELRRETLHDERVAHACRFDAPALSRVGVEDPEIIACRLHLVQVGERRNRILGGC